jgi:hypothetical protein
MAMFDHIIKRLLPDGLTHNTGPDCFNADISGCLPEVIVEMLVQSQPCNITLLPALPEEPPAGQTSGVSCCGRVTIDNLKGSFEDN